MQSVLRNSGEGALEFAHRYHNMPAFLECRDGASGTATFDGSQAAAFSRAFTRHMFTFAGAEADPVLTKAFDMAQTTRVDGANVVFNAEWISPRASAELNGPALHSVVFWDSRSMPCATFEPIHARVTVEPGKSWSTQMRWVARLD